ncbi:MAG TPA: SDR family NAD(P)-dependent oxidoreductase [Candidatus Acidoferrum sp.]|nr:SDR family NAD(P)-dependent oxidoreductase [Candidatus Acidoferrum sp.]
MAVPSNYQPPDLKGRVALVAGATRGVGRGAALALGEAGATVYCTGRSTKANRLPRGRSKKISPFDYSRRPETVEETAEMVSARGGKGIVAVLDHTDSKQVAKLIARIREEQGKLHVVVNDISETIPHDLGKTFWKLNLENGFANLRNAIHTHIITNHFAAPLLMETAAKSKSPGLIVGIGDGDSYVYRGHIFFDMVKTTVIRMAFGMARELRRKNVAAVALSPGYLRSEAMLEHFGVTEATWREAIKNNADYATSETPLYAGRAIAALAADPNLMKKSGRVFSSWGLSEEYPFCDADGRRPHCGKHFAEKYPDMMLRPCDEGFYKYWSGGPLETMYADWP